MEKNTTYRLEGFRHYSGAIQFEAERLTLIVGKNTVGKSTILKAISLMADSLMSTSGLKLNYNGSNRVGHGIVGPEGVVPRKRKGDRARPFQFSRMSNGVKKSYQYDLTTEKRSIDLHKLTFSTESGVTLIEVTFWTKKCKLQVHPSLIAEIESMRSDESVARRRGIWQFKLEEIVGGELLKSDVEYVKYEFDLPNADRDLRSFRQLSRLWRNRLVHPKPSDADFDPVQVALKGVERVVKDKAKGLNNELLSELNKALKRLDTEREKRHKAHLELEDIHLVMQLMDVVDAHTQDVRVLHVSSKRAIPPRVIGRGHVAWDQYFDLHMNPDKRVSDFMAKWMDRLSLGKGFDVVLIEGEVIKLMIDEGNGVRMNIADKAMGEAQLIGLLFALARAVSYSNPVRRGRFGGGNVVLILEEPESNLHPDAQAKLLDPLLEIIRDYNEIQIFIETHSEYLVRALQAKALEKEMSKLVVDDVVVNYVSGDSSARAIRILENGALSDEFDGGFYDASYDLTMRLFQQ